MTTRLRSQATVAVSAWGPLVGFFISAAAPSMAAGTSLTPGVAQELGPLIGISALKRISTLPLPLDVDLDGDLDLVSVDRLSGEVYYFENYGNVGFERPRVLSMDIGVDASPLTLGVDDFDGDGTPELFLVTETNSTSSFNLLRYSLTGPETLVLQETEPIPSLEDPGQRIEFEDINGDLINDLVFRERITYLTQEETWVGLRQAGGFQFVDISVPFGTADSVGLADFDADGLTDYIARTGTREVSVVPQTSPGIFGTPIEIDGNAFAVRIENALAADFNGDGILDPLLFYDETRGMVLHRGLSNGGFGPRLSLAGTVGLSRATVYDADFDGDVDLLLPGSNGVRWIENLGGLNFAEPASFQNGGKARGLDQLLLVDLNGDGLDDLLASTGAWAWVAYQTALGLGTGAEVDVLSDSDGNGRTVVAADLDRDQDLDLVSANSLAIAENRGPGTFELPRDISESVGTLRAVKGGDLDGDGFDDLVVTLFNGELVWLRNTGPWQLEPIQIGLSSEFLALGLSLSDMDGDGDLDIVSTTPGGFGLQMHLQGPAGTFTQTPIDPGLGGAIDRVEVADFSGDGRLDVAFAVPDLTLVAWVEQAPDGTFSAPVILTSDPNLDGPELFVGDLDGSGVADLGWVSDSTPEVIVSRSMAGSLEAPIVIATVPNTPRAAIARPQSNGSGMDIVVSVSSPVGQVLFLPRIGNGLSYGPPVILTEEIDFPSRLLAEDLDGDGDTDIVVTGSIGWFKGTEVTTVGDLYCAGVASNSTGRRGEIAAVGSRAIVDADLTIIASDLPPTSLTLFITSQTRVSEPNAGGGEGTLCVGGSVGRFGQPGQVGPTNADGQRRLTVDLLAIPQPMGAVSALAGEEWAFQAWHRDSASSGLPTSNFSDAVAVTFQ